MSAPTSCIQKYSWSHVNQVACALRFFYGNTLSQKEAFERIVTGKDPEKLPPVLDYEEVARFLEAVEGMRNRVALASAYAAATGLHVREVVRLKAASIDSQRMLLHIEAGKGGRDRYAMLSPGFWIFSVPTGSGHSPAYGCFRARSQAIISALALSRTPVGAQGSVLELTNT